MHDDSYTRFLAGAYAFLAAAYAQPGESVLANLDGLAASLQTPDAPSRVCIDECLNLLHQSNPSDLTVDHARLFVGPFELFAHPFGSVYLDDGHQLLGESTMDAARLYAEAGLGMSDDFRNPPDHVTAELEFLSHLCSRELETSAAGDPVAADYRDLHREFFTNHLGAWGFRFADNVEKHAETGFYKAVARLTRAVLALDKASLAVEEAAV